MSLRIHSGYCGGELGTPNATCHRPTSIAAFLQQAEQNLALLGSKGDASWPSARRASTPSANHVLSRDSSYSNSLAINQAPQVIQRGRERDRSRHREESCDGDSQSRAMMNTALLDTLTSKVEGSRTSVDQALQKVEDRHSETREQMDVQAKTMLGLDRKVKAFESRLQAVEAAVAAAADMAQGARKAAGAAARAASNSDRMNDADAADNRAHSPGPSDCGARGSRSVERQRQRDVAELDRRITAIAESSRKDREIGNRKAEMIARRAAEEEIKKAVLKRLESLEVLMQEQAERLRDEVKKHADHLGKDIATELLRGPVVELVERRAKDVEIELRAAVEKQLKTFDHVRTNFSERLDQIVQEKVAGALGHETLASCAQLANAKTTKETSPTEASVGSSTVGKAPTTLLKSTIETVAELEARAQNEERTYWEVVQSLVQRVGGLEGLYAEAEHDRVSVRQQLERLEATLPNRAHRAVGAVTQDPAVRRQYGNASSPPRGVGQYSNRPASPPPMQRTINLEPTPNAATPSSSENARQPHFGGTLDSVSDAWLDTSCRPRPSDPESGLIITPRNAQERAWNCIPSRDISNRHNGKEGSNSGSRKGPGFQASTRKFDTNSNRSDDELKFDCSSQASDDNAFEQVGSDVTFGVGSGSTTARPEVPIESLFSTRRSASVASAAVALASAAVAASVATNKVSSALKKADATTPSPEEMAPTPDPDRRKTEPDPGRRKTQPDSDRRKTEADPDRRKAEPATSSRVDGSPPATPEPPVLAEVDVDHLVASLDSAGTPSRASSPPPVLPDEEEKEEEKVAAASAEQGLDTAGTPPADDPPLETSEWDDIVTGLQQSPLVAAAESPGNEVSRQVEGGGEDAPAEEEEGAEEVVEEWYYEEGEEEEKVNEEEINIDEIIGDDTFGSDEDLPL